MMYWCFILLVIEGKFAVFNGQHLKGIYIQAVMILWREIENTCSTCHTCKVFNGIPHLLFIGAGLFNSSNQDGEAS